MGRPRTRTLFPYTTLFRSREGKEPKPMMNERGKSDPAVVAAKPANKAEPSAAEPAERRAGTRADEHTHEMHRSHSRETMSQMLARIRQNVPANIAKAFATE